MAEGDNSNAGVQVDQQRAEADPHAAHRREMAKNFDRQNTLNDLRNRLSQLDNKMKTISVRDGTGYHLTFSTFACAES
jgi:hypothetical protein